MPSHMQTLAQQNPICALQLPLRGAVQHIWDVGRLWGGFGFWLEEKKNSGSHCIYMTAWWAAGAISWSYPPSGECDWKCPHMFSTHSPKPVTVTSLNHELSWAHEEIYAFVHFVLLKLKFYILKNQEKCREKVVFSRCHLLSKKTFLLPNIM